MANNFTRLALVLLEISFLLVVTLSLAVKIPGYIRGQKTGRLLVRNPGNVNVIFLLSVLKKIYRHGYQYKKAGVIVMGIGADSPIQQDLFDINAEQFQKMKRLGEVIDRINRMQGSETIVLGSQQYTRKDGKGKADVFANAIKHDYRSPNPTTRWSDVIKLK